MDLSSEKSKKLCEVVKANYFSGEIRDVRCFQQQRCSRDFSSRETARFLLKMPFSRVNDEFQPSTFPIGIAYKSNNDKYGLNPTNQ